MKRHLSLLACLVVVIAMVCTLASCDIINSIIPGIGGCDHEFTGEVTKEATCTEEGVETLTCTKCGFSENKPIDPKGHTEADVAGTPATCTEDGLSDGKVCSVCNATTVAQQIIPALGHNYVDGVCSMCNNKFAVETTDTYGWADEYTFKATESGTYTFILPAGLGVYSKAEFDSFGAPEMDFYDNTEGASFEIQIAKGDSFVFYVGAMTKGEWVIDWTFVAGDVEAGGDDPIVGATELVVGYNTVVFAEGELSEGKTFTFIVTEEGTYTFNGDLMAVVMDADGNTLGRGQVYLTAGNYTVALFSMMPLPATSFTVNITFDAPATGEPDGSEQFPYIWDTLPESVTFESDNINMVYYIFTATVDGYVTFTWAVEENDWFNIYELDEDGNTTENNISGFTKTSHKFPVEAGKSYRVGLGTWTEGGETVVTIAETACEHSWSEATCEIASVCANCGCTTGDTAEHTPSTENPTCANPSVCTVCGMELSYIDHTWGEPTDIIAPDCSTETNGSQTLTCTICGATQVEELWFFHDWVIDVNVQATCTEDGRYEAHCSVCNATEAHDNEAQGHYNYHLSCGESGECMECGETFTLEHAGDPATCTDPMFCYGCWSYVGDPLGHSYESVVTDPTCTTGGYTTHTCTVCSDSYTDSQTDAAGHADNNGDFKCDACSTKMLPADGTALTIPEALAIAKLHASNQYTTQKYYITGIVTNVYNTQYGNLYLKDADGNEICIYGLYSSDGSTRYDAMSYKPVEGDELTVYTVLGMYNSTAQGKNAWMDEVVAHEHNYDAVVTEPTCTKGGYTTHTCSICNGYYTDAETEALGHTTEEGTCERCGLTMGGDVVNNETFTADFNTISSTNTSYVKSTTTSGWVANNCAVMGGGTSDSNPKFKVFGEASTRAFTLNGKTSAKGSLVSPTIADGLSYLSFNYTNCFSENKGVDITITVKQDGVAVATKRLDNDSVTKLTAYTFEWDLAAEGVAVSGNFTIEITNNSPSNSTSNKDRVSIWNLQWTTNK